MVIEADGGERLLPERWAASWAEQPDAEALVIDGGLAARMSGGELLEETEAIAAGIVGLAPHRGDRVVWEAEASRSSVLAALAVMRAGRVLVPVSSRQSDLERATVIEDVDPAIVISERPLSEGDPRWRTPGSLADLSPGLALEPPSAEDLALIVYTSGTTGQPKGAMLTHANLAAQAAALIEAWGWREGDRLLTALPLFHVHGLVVALFTGLAAGGAVLLESAFDASGFVDRAVEEEATMAFCVPSMLYRIDRLERAGRLAELRLIVSGSAPLSPELSSSFADRGIDILERYGMTETLLTVSNPLDGERRPGTVGFALPGVELLLPPAGGEPAELKVSGPTVFPGYWRRPDATSEVLADGWMSTGDIVRVDPDGYVVVCGRAKELIISGGFNVYPVEVEDVLLGVDGVLEAAVVGSPSAEWGEEVVAHIVTTSGSLDEPALRSAAEVLSPYKRPKRYVLADELPRNALGKLQRQLLR